MSSGYRKISKEKLKNTNPEDLKLKSDEVEIADDKINQKEKIFRTMKDNNYRLRTNNQGSSVQKKEEKTTGQNFNIMTEPQSKSELGKKLESQIIEDKENYRLYARGHKIKEPKTLDKKAIDCQTCEEEKCMLENPPKKYEVNTINKRNDLKCTPPRKNIYYQHFDPFKSDNKFNPNKKLKGVNEPKRADVFVTGTKVQPNYVDNYKYLEVKGTISETEKPKRRVYLVYK